MSKTDTFREVADVVPKKWHKVFIFHALRKSMPKPSNSQPQMTLLLLQEAIWQVEERLNVITESVVDQEAEIIRLKRLCDLHSRRLESFESRLKAKRVGGSENA